MSTSRPLTDSIVELRFPGSPEYLRLARLAAADAASRVGLDFDEIEDLRIAVSELCAIAGSQGGQVTLAFSLESGAVVVEGGGNGRGDGQQTDMARALIAAVVDEHDIDLGPDGTRFTATKRHKP